MALETVRVRVVDDTLAANPVPGVVVRFFLASDDTFITQGTTDGDGWCEVTLDGLGEPGGLGSSSLGSGPIGDGEDFTNYEARFYLVGGSFSAPQLLTVYTPASSSPTGTNDFQVTAHVRTLLEATDPRLCKVSGVVRGPDGRIKKGADIAFVSVLAPVVSQGDTILGERVNTRSDASGFVVVELFRNASYDVVVESHDNVPRRVHVPDRAALALGDLLFPVLAKVEWDPEPAPYWTISAGSTLTVTPTLTSSDYYVLQGLALEDVDYNIDDAAVASVEAAENEAIKINALSTGTTSLRVTRRDTSLVRDPDAILGTPITVHVV